MRQSKMTKVMALMLSMTMITSVFVGNTLSRYVTSVSSTDSARVAVWGINGEETTMNLFDTKYIVDGKTVAEANNKIDKIIAPGTKGEAEFNIINFEQDVAPEVAYEVRIELDDSQIAEEIKNNTSIQWKLDNGEFGTWDELKTAILSLSGSAEGRHVYEPGQFATAFQGTQKHTIAWQWMLDDNNVQDTAMGNDAVDEDIMAKIVVKVTAKQVQDDTIISTGGGAVEDVSDSVGQINSEKTISLSSDLEADVYTLRYENTDDVLEDYADIVTLEPGDSYDDFINENIAPQEATKIGVYNSSDDRVGSIALIPSLKPNLGTKLYSFGALSDIHISNDSGDIKFNNVLTYFEETEKVNFITVNGDLIQNNLSQLDIYKNIIEAVDIPVYSVAGNHEGMQMADVENEISTYTGNPLYYSFNKGNDVFIMVGNVSNTKGSLFAEGELQWLYETLEANKDKRCFVFEHVRPIEGSGNANVTESDINGSIWGGAEAEAFESLMKHYKNTLFFHGHSHDSVELQNLASTANIDTIRGTYSIHIPGFDNVDNGTTYVSSENEGYVVDVYEKGVVVRARKFNENKFLPIGNYYLSTPSKIVNVNTFIDNTGYINDSRETINTNLTHGEAPYTYGADIGILQSMSNLYTTDIIPLESGYEYTIIGTEVNFNCYPVWYNANGGYISGSNNSDEGWKASTPQNRLYVLNPPEGAIGFRLAGSSTDIDLVKNKLKIKRVPDNSKVYCGSVSYDIINGVKLSTTTGMVEENHERYSHSDYIAIDNTKSYILRADAIALGTYNTTISVVYYNADKSFNSYSAMVLGTDTEGKDKEYYKLNIPDGAKYIRLRIWHQTGNNENCSKLYTLIEK